LKAYSEKLTNELGKVEQEIKIEKSNLAGLQKEVSKYQKNIEQQKKNLSSLDKEIQNLSKLKQTLVSALTPQLPARQIASKGAPRHTPIWNSPPADFSDLSNSLRELTQLDVTVEPIKMGEQDFMRVKTKISYGDVNSIFLTSRGKRQAAGFTEGAISLGFNTAKLVYSKLADTQSRRARRRSS